MAHRLPLAVALVCSASLVLGSGAPAAADVPASQLFDVACPSENQCTAIGEGAELTFNPGVLRTPVPIPIAPPAPLSPPFLTGIACPSTRQCTAVGSGGSEISFNPRDPGTLTAATIAPGNFTGAVSCPSVTQCTAIANVGAVTFNPAAPGNPAPFDFSTKLEPHLLGGSHSLSCPSASQCTSIDGRGREVTFNPTAPGSLTPRVLLPVLEGKLEDVACPSMRQCTATGTREVTFDPVAPGAVPRVIAAGPVPGSPVACPRVAQCTVLHDTPALGQFATDATFDPLVTPTPVPMPIYTSSIRGLSCPSPGQCTTVDVEGREVTFDPRAPGSAIPVQIDTLLGSLAGITGTGVSGTEVAVAIRCTGFYRPCRAKLRLSRGALSFATASIEVPLNASAGVALPLDRTGRRLLAARHALPVTLSMAQHGSPPTHRTVVLRKKPGRPPRKPPSPRARH